MKIFVAITALLLFGCTKQVIVPRDVSTSYSYMSKPSWLVIEYERFPAGNAWKISIYDDIRASAYLSSELISSWCPAETYVYTRLWQDEEAIAGDTLEIVLTTTRESVWTEILK